MNHYTGSTFNRTLVTYNSNVTGKKYWTDKLACMGPEFIFPVKPGLTSGTGAVSGPVTIEFDPELVSRLDNICPDHRSLFIFLAAVLDIQLLKFSDATAFTIGTAVERSLESSDPLNLILPLVISAKQDALHVSDLLQLIKQLYAGALEHQNYPVQFLFDKVFASQTNQRMFNVAVTLENIHLTEAFAGTDRPDLYLEFKKYDDRLSCSLQYNTEVYSEDEISVFARAYQAVLKNCLSNPKQLIRSIGVCTDEEQQKVIGKLNDTASIYASEDSIQRLFEQYAHQFPDRIALVDDDLQISYHVLNQQANSLADILLEMGVKKNTCVVVLQKISKEYIIALLAILKAGGIYVPAAPENPKNSLSFLLEDTGSDIIITTETCLETNEIDLYLFNTSAYIPGQNQYVSGRKALLLDKLNLNDTALTAGNPEQPFDLAYIMYTSGSTGKPKGVLIAHKNVVSLVKGTDYVPFSQHTRILSTGAPTFDATTFEIWGSLLNGGMLVLLDKQLLPDPEALQQSLIRNHVNTLWLTSPLFNHFIQAGNAAIFSTLDTLVVGGDVLSPFYINQVRQVNRRLRVVNGYGPTENTTFSLVMNIDQDYHSSIPIGKPLNNRCAYVLGNDLNPRPLHIWGILYVGGDGMSRGYLNNPELTSEKFIHSPFQDETLLYRTDDIARVLPDLNIEFKGRADNQVKIQGYRVEPGEVESQLLKMKGVDSCLVLAKEDELGEKHLCAYLIGSSHIDTHAVRQFLSANLPAYMLPKFFIQLTKFPVNSHGKIDIGALPDTAEIRKDTPPAELNDVQQQLAEIWSSLLQIDQNAITLNSDFFELGGHSLHAISLLSRIHKALSVKITLPQLLKLQSLKELSDYIKTANQENYAPIKPAEKKEYYQLSSAQTRIYIIQQLNAASTAYNMVSCTVLHGSPDLEKISDDFKKIIERHQSLRTAFMSDGTAIYQKIREDVPFSVSYTDAYDNLEDYIRDFTQPFDLAIAPLLRAAIIKLSDEKYLLLLDMHHIISDGLSQDILLKEFEFIKNGRPVKNNRLQYKDFAEWQRSAYYSSLLREDETYWLKEFQGTLPVLDLPLDFERPKIKQYAGKSVRFRLDDMLTTAIQRYCRKTEVSLHTFLFTIWSIVLSKYTGQDELIIGTPTSGRKHQETESMVGMFVNTLPIRCFAHSGKQFSSYLKEVKDKIQEALEHQRFAFEDLIDRLEIHRTTNRNPLFDVCFNLLRSPGNADGFEEDESFNQIAQRTSKFDLTLDAIEFDQHIRISLEYDISIFKPETIVRIAESFLKVAGIAANEPDMALSGLDVLSYSEYQLLVDTFNNYTLPVSPDATIHSMIGRVLLENSTAVALKDQAGTLTYGMLDQLANGLASRLQTEGVGVGEVVGLSTGNIKEMVVAMLGILKAGAAFLPFDPGLPNERIRQMLTLSGSKLVICQESLSYRFGGFAKTIAVESIVTHTVAVPFSTGVESRESIAYILFTSGSTGVPNGVKVSHRALMNLCTWHAHYYAINSEDIAIKYSSLSFDATIWEIFPYLCQGSSLYFIEQDARYDLEKLNDLMERECVTIAFLPTQIGEKFSSVKNKSLRKLLLGGDMLKQIDRAVNSYEIYNNYGPTENTVVTTAGKIDRDKRLFHIGKPIANTKVYVLRPGGSDLCPLNVPGELCIAGQSLSSGYIDAELNQKSFLPNPFSTEGLMYRTGDLVRWLPEGNMEFLGRINDQVKIRGYRIELSEIESQLATMPQIEEAVALYYPENDGFMCGFYTHNEAVSPAEIKKYLGDRLPSYMIPTAFVALEKMPLNYSGKIDKKQLPAPVITGHSTYQPPESDLESQLVNIWSEILSMSREKIGTNDNFFEIGGNSLKIIQLRNKIKSELKADVQVVSLFEYTTIQEFSEFLKNEITYRDAEWKKLACQEQETLTILDQTLKALEG